MEIYVGIDIVEIEVFGNVNIGFIVFKEVYLEKEVCFYIN